MMKSITDTELDITNIYFAHQNVFTSKICSHLDKGRYSDCLFYVIDGAAEYSFAPQSGGKTYNVRKGDVVYLAKNSLYVITVQKEPYNVVYVDFDFSNTGNNESELFRDESLTPTLSLFSRINSIMKAQLPMHNTACKALIYEIYYYLLMSRINVYIPSAKRTCINDAVEYIRKNLSDTELGSPKLAELADMSDVHFRRIFKGVYHMPPVKYILLFRINVAKELLSGSDKTISEIAAQCGFSNVYYFSHRFKKVTGMAPTDYRRLIG